MSEQKKRLEKGAGRGVVLRLMRLMTPFLPAIGLCVLCVLLVNAAELVKPYVLKIVVDDYLTTGVDAAHFVPDNACTRGQIVTFLYRDLG